MGAWGTSPFEHDGSLDFLYLINEAPSEDILDEAFNHVFENEEDYIDTDICSSALMAGEIIATVNGKPSTKYNGQMEFNFESLKNQISTDLIEKGIEAINIVKSSEKSELRELWEEADFEDWLAEVENLIERMKSI
jgi:hypothetical protein